MSARPLPAAGELALGRVHHDAREARGHDALKQ